MKLIIKKSRNYSDKTGSLIPYYIKNSFSNFKINRFFFVYGNKKYFRADHAHKRCNQILIPVFGKIKVEITSRKKNKTNFLISHKNNKYLFVPRLHWIRLKFIVKDSILLTLCDHKYEKKEYIQSKNEFYKFK